MRQASYLAILIFLFLGCKPDQEELLVPDTEAYIVQLPSHFPPLPVPESNPLTSKKVELGRLLFHDVRLSRDGSTSCASCHLQHLAFSDGEEISIGIEERIGLRNSPSLVNVAYQPRLFFDGGVPTLEMQILAPISDVNEMDHNILLASEDLDADPALHQLSMEVFDQGINPFTLTRSIAAYERTIVSANSKYDQFLAGDIELSTDEEAGRELFFSEEIGCGSCHSGVLLTDFEYSNIGQYSNYEDPGRERITFDENDIGKFKTPSLRNIEYTAPYLHDGSIESLEQVIDFFATGGVDHVNQDPRMQAFSIDNLEKEQLIAFLKTLSDPYILADPQFQIQQ
ncbi:MAG: cytochrome-c peroxidase [Flavobacteriales bacterium]